MIAEAYVSFEIANLLKEKGFNWECQAIWYDNRIVLLAHLIDNNSLLLTDEYKFTIQKESLITIPTLQMTCAWLREVHNIFILVGWNPIHKEYFTRIFNMTDGCPKRNIHEHASYEEAIEEALKYTLENLI